MHLFPGARLLAAATGVSIAMSACTIGPLQVTEENEFPLRSSIFAGDGHLLGTVYEVNRAKVEFEAIPDHVRDAFVAAEDERFWTHSGIDPLAIGRAIMANVRSGSKLQGGSTITMQLAKLLYADPVGRRSIEQKLFEARVAHDLEERYSKQRILTMYLNRAYFGQRAYGIRAAAETFFAKHPKSLTLAEGAMLAGLVRAPTSYNPFRYIKQAKIRRRYVLGRMLELQMITRAAYDVATVEPLTLKRTEYTQTIKQPYWVEYIERETLSTKAFGETEEERARQLYRGGLHIKTTLNRRWQRWAEAAVKEALPYPDDPEAALVAIDVRTGAIRAMVGGRSFKQDQFDIASQGFRQPGSAFKPFVMAAALEQGISPESRYASAPTTLQIGGGATWKVDNYDGADRGVLTLRQGMMASVNGVYARLMMRVGPEAVVDVAQRLGIRKSRLDPYPAIALGGLTYGVTPLEMASAYSTIANAGLYNPPHGIARARDANGKVLFDETKVEPEQVFDPNLAYTLTGMLEDVACCGTGVHAQIGRPMTAKTGTTNELKDAWLIGYTRHVATVVWVGYRKPKAMFNVRGIKVVGGSFPSQIWRTFMSKVEAEFPEEDFVNPPGEAVLRSVNGATERCRKGSGSIPDLDPDTEIRSCPSTSASPTAEPEPTRTNQPPPGPGPGPSTPPPTTPPPTTSPPTTPPPTTPPPTTPPPTETPKPDPTETPKPDPTETPTPDPTGTPMEAAGGGASIHDPGG